MRSVKDLRLPITLANCGEGDVGVICGGDGELDPWWVWTARRQFDMQHLRDKARGMTTEKLVPLWRSTKYILDQILELPGSLQELDEELIRFFAGLTLPGSAWLGIKVDLRTDRLVEAYLPDAHGDHCLRYSLLRMLQSFAVSDLSRCGWCSAYYHPAVDRGRRLRHYCCGKCNTQKGSAMQRGVDIPMESRGRLCGKYHHRREGGG